MKEEDGGATCGGVRHVAMRWRPPCEVGSLPRDLCQAGSAPGQDGVGSGSNGPVSSLNRRSLWEAYSGSAAAWERSRGSAATAGVKGSGHHPPQLPESMGPDKNIQGRVGLGLKKHLCCPPQSTPTGQLDYKDQGRHSSGHMPGRLWVMGVSVTWPGEHGLGDQEPPSESAPSPKTLELQPLGRTAGLGTGAPPTHGAGVRPGQAHAGIPRTCRPC